MLVGNAVKVLLLIGAASLVAALAHAQIGPGAVFMFTFKADTRADRISSARAMLTHVEYVSSTLPTMRPSEKEWLAKERAAIGNLKDTAVSNERMKQLVMSVEFQHSDLDYMLTNVREALDCVIQAGVTTRREAFCWAVVAYHLNYPDLTYAIGNLRKAGRMSRVNLSAMGGGKPVDDDDSLALLYRMGARNIQESVVLPYLRGDLK
jgi:hypothetical protein